MTAVMHPTPAAYKQHPARAARRFFNCPPDAQASTVRIDVSHLGDRTAWAWHDDTAHRFQVGVVEAEKTDPARSELTAIACALRGANRPLKIFTANQGVIAQFKALKASGQIARWQQGDQRSARKVNNVDLWKQIAREVATVQTELIYEPRRHARAAARSLGNWAERGLAVHALKSPSSKLCRKVQTKAGALVLHSDASFDHNTNIGALAVHSNASNSTTVSIVNITSSYLAEFQAVVFAARTAAEAGAKHVLINTDCLGVVNVIRRHKSGTKAGEERAALRELEELRERFVQFDVRWVKGHANVAGNRQADVAARAALRASVKEAPVKVAQ